MGTTRGRTRRDRCPGITRPWSADDGLLVRVRLRGGALTRTQLLALVDLAERRGSGRVFLTNRANLQVRGFEGIDGQLPDEVLRELDAMGVAGPASHDLVRNYLVSPGTGLAGGRADLRPVVAALDALVTGSDELAQLPGKFLFVLDDGRGDLVDHWCDLGLVALDAERAQLRVGSGWGEVVALSQAPRALAELALHFLSVRGTDETAAWHVDELDAPLVPTGSPDAAVPAPAGPLAFGPGAAGVHVPVAEEGLDRAGIEALGGEELVVTPWRGILVPTNGAA